MTLSLTPASKILEGYWGIQNFDAQTEKPHSLKKKKKEF